MDLEHYLDVLEHKPGALAGSKPLARWREKGLWPDSYDHLLDDLIGRHGKQSGTRQMIQWSVWPNSTGTSGYGRRSKVPWR
jgi:hypothetical protein